MLANTATAGYQHGKIVEGVFAINKPPGISSAQALRELQTHFTPSRLFAPLISHAAAEQDRNNRLNKRKRFKPAPRKLKIGHGGTLDPAATGVLIVGIGTGTKELQTFLECTKSYEAVVLFGAATDTYDAEGKVLQKMPYDHITEELVKDKLAQYRGRIMQRPPIFSALRIEGKRLYEYAREGEVPPVEIKERPVEVLDIQVVEFLRGGAHPYKWPDREAELEEKAVAKDLLHPEVYHKQGPGDPEPATPGMEHTLRPPKLKRKRSDSTDDLAMEVLPKKSPEESEEAIMSGALEPITNSREDSLADQSPQPGSLDATVQVAEPIHATSCNPPAAKIRMTVTSGFYVRSLCHDLGQAVGSLAIMSALVRTRQGNFELGNNVLKFDDVIKGENVWAPQVERMLDDWSMQGGEA